MCGGKIKQKQIYTSGGIPGCVLTIFFMLFQYIIRLSSTVGDLPSENLKVIHLFSVSLDLLAELNVFF